LLNLTRSRAPPPQIAVVQRSCRGPTMLRVSAKQRR
jgi:hypothetical protein